MCRAIYLLTICCLLAGCAQTAGGRRPASQASEPVNSLLTRACERKMEKVIKTAWSIGDRENHDVMRLTSQLINQQAKMVNFRCLERYGQREFARCKFEMLERGRLAYWELALDVNVECEVFSATAHALALR